MSGTSVANSVTLEPLDKQIVRCLQLRPRVPFSLVAEVLEVSEQTVARRFGRLRRLGVMRVIAVIDPRGLGESDWIVRAHCRPDATMDVARALARRDDIAWVSVSAGGSELIATVRSRTQADRERLLIDRLPRTAAVLDLSASIILRRYAGGGASDWFPVDDVITREQAERIGAEQIEPRNPRPSDITLGAADEAVLAALTQDGRTPFRELARIADTTEGRITRRVNALLDAGVVYLDVDLSGVLLGYAVSAYVWLTVLPGSLDAACRALAAHAETPFVAAISGRSNVIASVVCRNLDHLYEYVTTKVGAIEGVLGSEISPVLRPVKRAGTLMDGDRLAVG